MKDIAVVIINFNTAQYTLQCVKSVLEKTDTSNSFEIIVVDNASQEKDYNFLLEHLPKLGNVKLVKSEINLGFGGGNMLGFKQTSARYLLFLNNDTLFQNDCISILCDFMVSNPQAGLATAQNFDEEGNLVPCFDHYRGLRKMVFGRGFLEATNPGKYPVRKKEYEEPLEVNWVNGAFMFFRTEDFLKAGGFDPNIFLFAEEIDIAYRLTRINRRTYLVPSARITHFKSKSTPKDGSLKRENFISHLYVNKKNRSLFNFTMIKLYFLLTFAVKPKKWHYYQVLLSSSPMKYSAKPKKN